MAVSYGLYTYGLMNKSPEQLAIWGIDKKNKVYPVWGKDICVMVSEIDVDTFQYAIKNLFCALNATTDQNGTREILQAHEDVVAALMKDTTIVPFKFGTILKDEEAASKMLQDEEQKFKELLSKFNDKVEWGLKIYSDNQEFMKHITHIEPEFKILEEKREKLSRGAAYLLGRKMEEELKHTITNRLASVSEAIFLELEKEAYEAKVNKTLPQKLTGHKKEMVLNVAYLIEKEKMAHFCKQGKRLREKYELLGLDLELSGPWPPYSFTY